MLDLTREIRLEQNWQKKYLYSRIFISILFLCIVLFVIYKILFPQRAFVFSFDNPNSSKNSIDIPRKADNSLYNNGNISKNSTLTFNSRAFGDFSEARIIISENKNSTNHPSGKIIARKSYEAFFAPLGKPLGFKNGTLLKSAENFFIISDDKLRKFQNAETAIQMGFKKEAFTEVALSDLLYNQAGEQISQTQNYPNDSIFHISDNYYQLKNGQLDQFISEKAYLTQYSVEQSVEKDSDFFKKYELSENSIGFNNGTLLSAGISVYVVSENLIYPINNPETFESMGYKWTDIIEANSEEIGIYDKGRLFTLNRPHPDGTIFFASDSKKFYRFFKNEKREIKSDAILKTYLKTNPIEIQDASLTTNNECEIKHMSLFFKKYGCTMPLISIEKFGGNYYEFKTDMKNETTINSINTVLSKIINWNNMRSSLSSLKNKVLKNYAIQ